MDVLDLYSLQTQGNEISSTPRRTAASFRDKARRRPLPLASKVSLNGTVLHRMVVTTGAPAQEAQQLPCRAAGARQHLEARVETWGTPPRAAQKAKEAAHLRHQGNKGRRRQPSSLKQEEPEVLQ